MADHNIYTCIYVSISIYMYMCMMMYSAYLAGSCKQTGGIQEDLYFVVGRGAPREISN